MDLRIYLLLDVARSANFRKRCVYFAITYFQSIPTVQCCALVELSLLSLHTGFDSKYNLKSEFEKL